MANQNVVAELKMRQIHRGPIAVDRSVAGVVGEIEREIRASQKRVTKAEAAVGDVLPVGLSDLYTDAARNIIESQGGEVRLNCPVTALEVQGSRIQGVRFANQECLSADAVISSLPPLVLSRILPVLPETRPLIEQLKDRGRIIIPVGSPFWTQTLMLVRKDGDKVRTQNLLPVRFVPFTRLDPE